MHTYTTHSARTGSVCGKGMRGIRVKERGTDTGTQISTEQEREREAKRQEDTGSMVEGVFSDTKQRV